MKSARFGTLLRISTLAMMAAAAATIGGCAGTDRRSEPGSLEVFATMNDVPGNVAVAPDGRVFVSMHPFGNPSNCVREVLSDGSTRVFPSGAWGGKPGADGIGLASVIGIECDARGTLWILDMGTDAIVPRLVAWDLSRDALSREISIQPPASVKGGFPQDLAIDSARPFIYIADMGLTGLGGATLPAIIVVDLRDGSSRRVLENAPALRSEPGAAMVIDGRAVFATGSDGKPFAPSLGINPITIDHRGEWVVFGAMHGRTLWRIRAADLANAKLNDEQLALRLEKFGEKPVSDGITIDRAGNVYTTDVNNNAISVTTPDGRSRVLVRDDARLRWADGLSFGPDGTLYATVNQLHRFAPLNNGKMEAQPPYLVVRVEPLSPGAQGR